MNQCIYEPLNGSYPNCNGACKTGEATCAYYFIDPVWNIINEWKKEAGVNKPVLWKFDRKRNKVCLYTTRPGLFIGRAGSTYQKYIAKLRETKNEKFRNDIDIIECEDGI